MDHHMIKSGERGTGPGTRRLAGLDGIRGLAALFVVIHHSWLMAYPGFPAPVGPWWTGWMAYGHLAVVVFIVLSGFSLAVSPARAGWRLSGIGTFARRRAWRILPPYWPALAFSLIMAWTVAAQPGEGAPTGKSVVIYGLLLQDVFGSPSPNGAFWSIAVEAQLYFAFPLLLLLMRRAGAAAMLGLVTVLVVAVGALAPNVHVVSMLMRLTPQFAVLFALGVVAAKIVTREPGSSGRWWPSGLPALLAAVPVLALVIVQGRPWTVGHFFWVDLAIGPAVALLLAAVAAGRPAPLVRALDTRPIRRLGSFSYSLYLIHAPIVVAVSLKLVRPHVDPGVPGLLATLAIAVPISVTAAWLFAEVFELPFQRHRGWAALHEAARARARTLRRIRSEVAAPLPVPMSVPAPGPEQQPQITPEIAPEQA